MPVTWKANGERLLLVSFERELTFDLVHASETRITLSRRPFGVVRERTYDFNIRAVRAANRKGMFFPSEIDLTRPEYDALWKLSQALMLALRCDYSPGPSFPFYEHRLKVINLTEEFIEFESNRLEERFWWTRENVEHCFGPMKTPATPDPRVPLLCSILWNAAQFVPQQLSLAH